MKYSSRRYSLTVRSISILPLLALRVLQSNIRLSQVSRLEAVSYTHLDVYKRQPEEYIPLLEETRCIKRWDAAPELPGAMQFGKYIAAKGVLASVGHTQAEFEDIQTAYEAGYTLSLIQI